MTHKPPLDQLAHETFVDILDHLFLEAVAEAYVKIEALFAGSDQQTSPLLPDDKINQRSTNTEDVKES